MHATSVQTLTEHEQHQLDMLLWQADVHDRNGKKQEACDIRTWVAGFLSAHPKEDVSQTDIFCEKRKRMFNPKTFL
jgi:hypothetical protein